MSGKIKLMSHLVADYPTEDVALTAARALVSGGAAILEIQLPFSDPSADGKDIQCACTEVLRCNYRTRDGLDFIRKLREEFPHIPIYIMSYASLIYTPGIADFCQRAAGCGVNGMIIPDLPFDFDEGLTQECKNNGMINIPVASPGMAEDRLKKLSSYGFPYIYASLRTGITGTDTNIDKDTLSFIQKVGANGSKVYGGFGIRSGEQSAKIAPYVDAVVAGSVFVRIIKADADDKDKLCSDIKAKAMEISHMD